MVYLVQFASYSFLYGIFGMPSSNYNNYITASTRDFEERNQVDMSASGNSIRKFPKNSGLWNVHHLEF